MIALILVRVPAMYQCAGQGSIQIGGLTVHCPQTIIDARMLVRSGANCYVTLRAPMAVLGLGNLVRVLRARRTAQRA